LPAGPSVSESPKDPTYPLFRFPQPRQMAVRKTRRLALHSLSFLYYCGVRLFENVRIVARGAGAAGAAAAGAAAAGAAVP